MSNAFWKVCFCSDETFHSDSAGHPTRVPYTPQGCRAAVLLVMGTLLLGWQFEEVSLRDQRAMAPAASVSLLCYGPDSRSWGCKRTGQESFDSLHTSQQDHSAHRVLAGPSVCTPRSHLGQLALVETVSCQSFWEIAILGVHSAPR